MLAASSSSVCLLGVDLRGADVVDHLLRHRPALAAEQVERHAARDRAQTAGSPSASLILAML